MSASKSISISIPHSLGQDVARQRIASGISSLRNQFGAQASNVQETWVDNHLDFRFSVMGQAVTGRADVRPAAVDLQIDLPWLLAALAEKIRPRLQQEASRLLK